VPLYRRRQKERGFNQAQIIARELARIKKLELVDNALVKIKNVAPQTSLEARERAQNVRGAFQVRRQEKLKNRVILLVDDVYTTGSTINECSLALKRAGVKDVRALTIAQA
jgi:competence protein ComFC